MTAPGNTILIVVLFALLVACTAYASGRLHQWYRTGQERDEAYRDGYDTATRSVFTLAARVIGPRRDRTAAKAPADVIDSTVAGDPAVSPDRTSGRRRKWQRNAPPVSVTRPAPLPPVPAGPLTPDQLALPPIDTAADPLVPGLVVFGSAVTHEVPPRSALTPPAEEAPEPFERLVVGPPCGELPEAEEPEVSVGRHFVPDELVQAPTYRLTPDRVARAKVREAVQPADGEVTTRLPVPRPRSS